MLYAIPQGAPVLLVHAHSNGCDIGDMRQTLQSISESLRVHVMSFEYPGYGLHVGSASMWSIDDAVSTVLHFILNELQVNIAQVVWYGRSIGSGPAIRIAHRISKELNMQPAGVIVQCGYANFPEVAGHLFGRVAKRLVSPLWTNEALIKEISCPVLLIHGRADTMIPISQSEKLWDAVAMKELSNFHKCDCGHNDFNFRRCTLKPIYDFLLGVISSPHYPATNFHIEIAKSNHAFVHHIGALRAKIPVYSFHRPELEEWLRRLQRRCWSSDLGEIEFRPGQRILLMPANPGRQGILIEESNGSWRVRVDGGDLEIVKTDMIQSLEGPTSLMASTGGVQGATPIGAAEAQLTATGREVQRTSNASKSSEGVASQRPNSPAPKKRAKTGKADQAKEPPSIPDFCELPPLEDARAVLLDPEGMVRACATRVGAFLERLQMQLDRIDGLEAKPIEEVVDFVEAEFWASDPLMCLWEEVLLPKGDRVRLRLGPFFVDNRGKSGYGAGLGACGDSGTWMRIPLWVFCPSPAHFRCLAEWSLLHSERLARSLPAAGGQLHAGGCCCVPCRGLGRTKKPRKGGNGRGGQDSPARPTRGVLATSLSAHFANWVEKMSEVRAVFTKFAALHSDPKGVLSRPSLTLPAAGGETPEAPTSLPEGEAGPPWTSPWFSTAARSALREGALNPGPALTDLYTEVLQVSNDFAIDQRVQEMLAAAETSAGDANQSAERNADLAAARLVLDYERIAADEEVLPGDLLRPDARKAALNMSAAMRTFAQAEHRERHERRKWRPPPRAPQQPGAPPAGDVPLEPPVSTPPTISSVTEAPAEVALPVPSSTSQT